MQTSENSGIAELPRMSLLETVRKEFEQRANREFGRYAEHEMDRKEAFRGPQGYAAGASEAFSDSFSRHLGE